MKYTLRDGRVADTAGDLKVTASARGNSYYSVLSSVLERV